MSSIFTKIINGEIPCHKIAENDQFFSFMDIRPIAPGHTLVIPKVEIDRFFDLDNDVLSHFLPFAKPIAEAIEAVIPCERGKEIGCEGVLGLLFPELPSPFDAIGGRKLVAGGESKENVRVGGIPGECFSHEAGILQNHSCCQIPLGRVVVGSEV